LKLESSDPRRKFMLSHDRLGIVLSSCSTKNGEKRIRWRSKSCFCLFLTYFAPQRVARVYGVRSSPPPCPRACPRDGGQSQRPPAARTAFRATYARDNPRSMQCETRSVFFFATALIGRWQLVCRRLEWTRGAQQVSFMCCARASNNIATQR
jgi:hypothetical protein